MSNDEAQPSASHTSRTPSSPTHSRSEAEDVSQEQCRTSKDKAHDRSITEPVSVNTHTVNIAHSISPYLPAREAEAYERLHPGSLDRFLSMAEREQEANIRATATAQYFAKSDMARGHWLGWSATLVAIGCATFLGYLGDNVAAVAIVSIPVFSAIRGLIDGAKRN